MSNSQDTFLTPSQLTFILKSAIIGVGLLYLPNSLITAAKQNGWIGCIVGSAYPLYILFLGNVLCKNHPKDNILVLSKKYLGNILGTFLNIIFVFFFLFILTSEIAAFSNVFRVYATSFLKNHQVILATTIPCGYVAYKGVKPLGRLSETGFYITIILIFLPIAIIPHGSYLNLMPFFNANISQIISASKETAFFYTGMEVILLIYPFLNSSKKLLKCGIASMLIVASIYTWTALATIYYLGIDISMKFLWPILALADSIHIPIINSFRFIFLSLWAIVILKCISAYYFAFTYGLNQCIKKISAEKFVIFLYPLIIFLASLYGQPTTRRYYSDKLTKFYVLYNLIYVTLIAVVAHFKKGGTYEKK